jgi:mono/diheme cytochrome c family protein
MKRELFGWAVCAGLLVAGGAVAAGKADPGKVEYEVSCGVCHGITGKGDGPYKLSLSKAPTDLTLLQRRNNGIYPFDRVYAVIDGRADVAAHGTREMPIWGQRFSVAAAEYYVDVPYDPEVYVRARILAVTEYVYRLQVK